jgi:hypothetical protein
MVSKGTIYLFVVFLRQIDFSRPAKCSPTGIANWQLSFGPRLAKKNVPACAWI